MTGSRNYPQGSRWDYEFGIADFQGISEDTTHIYPVVGEHISGVFVKEGGHKEMLCPCAPWLSWVDFEDDRNKRRWVVTHAPFDIDLTLEREQES